MVHLKKNGTFVLLLGFYNLSFINHVNTTLTETGRDMASELQLIMHTFNPVYNITPLTYVPIMVYETMKAKTPASCYTAVCISWLLRWLQRYNTGFFGCAGVL